MKLAFFAFTGRWRVGASSPLLLLGLMLWAPLTMKATPPYSWISSDYGSFFTSAPSIDATNFFNTGFWSISTVSVSPAAALYETFHTLNYTNKGTMNCSLGWEFDFGPTSTGGRGWSANFLNDNNGTISALDGPVLNFLQQITQQSYLHVSATNLINKGLLTAGANGEIVLSGGNINLSHSGGVEITPISGVGSPSTPTNFAGDVAIYGDYWQATNGNLTVGGSPWFPPWWGSLPARMPPCPADCLAILLSGL